jgi:hypothetical protein
MPPSFDPNGNIVGLSGIPLCTITKISASGAGTYTPPPGCTYIYCVVAAGAGGGGGGFAAASGASGCGGGGGSAGNWLVGYYSANQSFSYNIGAGGTAGGIGLAGANGGITTWAPSSTGITETLTAGRAGQPGTATKGGAGGQSLSQAIINGTNVLVSGFGGAGSFGQNQNDNPAFTDVPEGGQGGGNIFGSVTNTGSGGGGGGGGAKNTIGRTGGTGYARIVEYYA